MTKRSVSRVFLLIIFFCQTFSLVGQVDSGLVAKYSFNSGTANDEAGTNDGRAYGLSLTEDRFGNAHSAFFFHGNNDSYLCLGTSSILKPKSGSIALWVNMEKIVYKGAGNLNNPFIYTRAFGGDDFNEAYALSYDYSAKKVDGSVSLSEASQAYLVPEKMQPIQKWDYLVLTYDNNYACLYVNGVLEAKAIKDFESIFYEGDSVLVGIRNGEKNKRNFRGSIDDIEIYDRVLSAAEVLSLYNAPNPNKNAVITKWIIIGLGIFISILFILWLIRKRIEKSVNIEREKSKLNVKMMELEIRALRAQMNPHFLFNALNTIQQFIIVEENDKARIYLSKFGKLVRKLLVSNTSDSTSLRDEISILEGYLEIEAQRFNNVFKYRIFVDQGVESLEFRIPHFLIQPFVENAIWHGLLPKEEDGERSLLISFEQISPDILCCRIDDNGVGRSHGAIEEQGEKGKPLAIDFTKQRLELMSKMWNSEYHIEIKDKIDAEGNSQGTTVILTIPILKVKI